MESPINDITWVDADLLEANDYNPNAVFTPELKLLERSILQTGWVQPVLVSKDMTIIDGFHRWMLTKESKKLREIWDGKLPVAMLDVDRSKAMILTVRMNRAKGSHIAIRMSSMVKELIDTHHLDKQELAAEIGATVAEIDLLYQDGVFTAKNIKNYKYSKAWVPAESAYDG
jgi:ParB-like chromosome segregation protein Spo0J